MKKKQWLQSLNGVDDKYVAEAAPTGAATRKRSGKSIRLISILAACMAFVLLCGTFALFIPYNTTPPSVASYASSPYYSIIQKFNAYHFEPPVFKNTFDFLIHLPSLAWEQVEDFAPGKMESGEESMTNGNYQEVTDNQVAGVIEADLIKRSDKHIYYLTDNTLLIYSIAGEQSKLLGSYGIAQYGVEGFSAEEFFLSADCTTLTVISSYTNKTGNARIPYVKVITLDVSDPASITELSNIDVSGGYLSSRLTEHGLLLMTTMYCNKPNYADESTFVPQVEMNGEMQSVAADQIIAPDELSTASYTVMLMMDATGQSVIDSAAFLSYSQDVYVSRDAIYATRTQNAYGEIKGNVQDYRVISEISCMKYGADGFDYHGSVMVDGFVLDQYSMDQYEGMLRVVTTTTSATRELRDHFDDNREVISMFVQNRNASLHVVDLASMEIIASVEEFAPMGETVQSVRFDGTAAYVCTAIQMTDPVFFFDLTNPANITYKETGTIEGFSSSLVNFADGYLLGIGRGGNGTELKVEIYTEGEETVESYCAIEFPYTDYHPEYKCYYIDRENGLVGLGIYTWDKVYLDDHVYRYENNRFEYLVLHFDGESISEVLRFDFGTHQYLREMRGVYVDGYYYALGGSQFSVKPLELE